MRSEGLRPGYMWVGGWVSFYRGYMYVCMYVCMARSWGLRAEREFELRLHRHIFERLRVGRRRLGLEWEWEWEWEWRGAPAENRIRQARHDWLKRVPRDAGPEYNMNTSYVITCLTKYYLITCLITLLPALLLTVLRVPCSTHHIKWA